MYTYTPRNDNGQFTTNTPPTAYTGLGVLIGMALTCFTLWLFGKDEKETEAK